MSAIPDDLEPVLEAVAEERHRQDIQAACAEEQHRYWQDGADGQGGIAGRCYCGERTDYPVGGAA